MYPTSFQTMNGISFFVLRNDKKKNNFKKTSMQLCLTFAWLHYNFTKELINSTKDPKQHMPSQQLEQFPNLFRVFLS